MEKNTILKTRYKLKRRGVILKSKMLRIVIIVNVIFLVIAFAQLHSLYEDVTVFVQVHDLLLQEKGSEFVSEIIPFGVNIIQVSKDNHDVINVFPLRTYTPIVIFLQTVFNLIAIIYIKKR